MIVSKACLKYARHYVSLAWLLKISWDESALDKKRAKDYYTTYKIF